MTSKILHHLLERTSLERRLELAAMDSELCAKVLFFSDVSLAVVKADGGIVLGNKERKVAETTVDKAKLCRTFPSLSQLVVESRLPKSDWEHLLSLPLKKLFLSSENLKELAQLAAETKSSVRSLHVIHNAYQPFSFHRQLSLVHLETFISSNLRRICLTNVFLSAQTVQRLFGIDTLTSVDLLGAVVDSEAVYKLQPSLAVPKALEEISLPPTWFSFGLPESYCQFPTTKTFYQEYYEAFDFSWLKVPKLCLSVQTYDERIFWKQLGTAMPKELQTLVLYGDCFPIRRAPQLAAWNKFGILFGPQTAQMLNFKGAGPVPLISHLVKTMRREKQADRHSWIYRSQSRRRSQKNAPVSPGHEDDLETAREPARQQRTVLGTRRRRVRSRRSSGSRARTQRRSGSRRVGTQRRSGSRRAGSQMSGGSRAGTERRSGSRAETSRRPEEEADVRTAKEPGHGNRPKTNKSGSGRAGIQKNSEKSPGAVRIDPDVTPAREPELESLHPSPSSVTGSSSMSPQVGSQTSPGNTGGGEEQEEEPNAVMEIILAQVSRRIGEMDGQQ